MRALGQGPNEDFRGENVSRPNGFAAESCGMERISVTIESFNNPPHL